MASSKLDICNRAIQKLGGNKLTDLNGTDIYTVAALRVYDDALASELRANNWNFAIKRKSLTAPTITITGITAAEPPVVTYTGTDPTDGDRIYIESVVGMTEVNGNYYSIGSVNSGANTLELLDPDDLTDVDGTGFTAYSSGGTGTICPTFGFNRKFALPSDFVRLIEVDGMSGVTANIGGIGYSNDHSIEGRYIVCNDSGPLFIRYVYLNTTVTDMDYLFTESLACRMALEMSTEIKQSDSNYQKLMQDYSIYIAAAKKSDAVETPGEVVFESDWLIARL